jgi:hypothetical protein
MHLSWSLDTKRKRKKKMKKKKTKSCGTCGTIFVQRLGVFQLGPIEHQVLDPIILFSWAALK